MGWGGARPNSGPKKDKQGPTLATDNGRLIIPPGLVEAIQANARERRKTRADNPHLNPFQLRQDLHPPACRPSKNVQMAMDEAIGWAGTDWGMGGPLNQVFAEGLMFPGYPFLSELALRPEYRTASEIISTEMTRKWIKFSGKGQAHQQRQRDRQLAQDLGLPEPHPEEREDDEREESDEKQEKISQLEEFLDNLDVRGAYRLLETNDGLFGRSHLHHEIAGNDGDTPEGREELKSDIGIGIGDISRSKVGKNRPLTRLKNIEPVWTYPTTYNAMNPLRDDFYKPSVWYMQGVEIHASRLFTQIGRPVPDLLKPAFSFGGLSLSQMMMPYVDIWLQTRESIGRLIHAFSVMVLMTDLQTMMQPGGGALMERANLFNAIRDNNGLFLLNKQTEDFKNVAVPLSGLHELQAQSQEHMCSIIRAPVAIFTGISPTGLNASSEGEIRIFENTIHAHQEARFRPNLTKTVNFAQLSLWDEVDPDIVYDFVQLRELTEKEEAELRKLDAETDDILINGCNAITPEEVRTRVAGDENGPHAGIDPGDLPEPPQPEPGEGGPEGGGQPGEGEAPGEPKPGGRIQIGGHQAYTGVGEDDAIADDEGEGDPGPTGGTFASLAEPQANPELHSGYQPGPLRGVNPAKKKKHEDDDRSFGRDAEWRESDHPRDKKGQFGSGSGSIFAALANKKAQKSGGEKKSIFATMAEKSSGGDIVKAIEKLESERGNYVAAEALKKEMPNITDKEIIELARNGKVLLAPYGGPVQHEPAVLIRDPQGNRFIGVARPREDKDFVGDAKAEKAGVHYRAGTKTKRCGLCTMFRAPDGCTAVAGVIHAADVCDLFEPNTVDDAEWHEEDHPRGKGGKFGEGGGGERIKFASAGAKRGEASGPAKAKPEHKPMTPERRAEMQKRFAEEMAAVEKKHGKAKTLSEMEGAPGGERVGFKSLGTTKKDG